MSAADIRHMKHALALAGRGLGQVWPNPSVGCVLVKDCRVVGRGRTAAGGRPHAETQALQMAGDLARGATAFVSLEPCAHEGKTPPCANALIEAGVARVVSACEDSDPRVAGKGHAMLRAAGIEVETGVCAEESQAMNEGFFLRTDLGRPMVTLKLASSFDGRIAMPSGESKWITGPEARRNVHVERSRHDAVFIGGGTARADDPTLNVRGLGVTHQPVRVIASQRLDLPLTGKLAQSARDVPLWLLHGANADAARKEAWQSTGARLIEVASADGQLDASGMLAALGKEGLTRVYCEGGGTLAATLLKSDLVDRISGYSAGVVLGADALASVGVLGFGQLADTPRFALSEIQRIGPDVLHRWVRQPG